MTQLEMSNQYKEQLSKKKNKANERSKIKSKKRQYNMQASNTKEDWKLNKKKSEDWRNKKFHNKPLSYKIRKFFDNFRRDPKPENGLVSNRQKRRSKRSFFSKIFKKKK